MQLDLSALPRQFRHWALHCSLNALPSFIIACMALQLWKHPPAIGAMLAAVCTFILLYTFITSLRGPFSDAAHPLHRAMKIGTRIRAILSLISVPVALSDGILILPDFWCGYIAAILVNQVAMFAGSQHPIFDMGSDSGDRAEFFPTFAVTMVEGLILSFLLLMVSFFALLFIHARDRRKARLIQGDALPVHSAKR